MVDAVKSESPQLAALRSAVPAVLPSLLMCDFGHLEREIRRLEDAGASALHLDVMDGHFVPNLSFGLPLVESIRSITNLPLDVHLMIANPADYVTRYVEAGANMVSFHIEVTDEAPKLLEQIRTSGAAAGIVLNPPTPVEQVLPVLEHCDFALVMSVMPGFGGQKFDPVALEKIQTIRSSANDSLLIEVDGGVNDETIQNCVRAGTDLLVAGSAITGGDDYKASFQQLTDLAQAAA